MSRIFKSFITYAVLPWLIVLPTLTRAQSLNMELGDNRGSGFFVNGCSGLTFYDSTGPSSDYTANEDNLTVFCPDAGEQIELFFNNLDLGSGDFLRIYNGDNTSAPLLADLSSIDTAPFTVVATSVNASGCLAVEFISDTTDQGSGWEILKSCVSSCQTIVTSITATPAIDSDGILRACQNEVISLMGSAFFSSDGTGATYEWDLADGRGFLSGQNQTVQYAAPGVYQIQFVARDGTGCEDDLRVDLIIQISTDPDFTGTEADRDTICLGEQVNLTGTVSTSEFFIDVSPPVAGTTPLPDGVGVSYETCITVDLFQPGQLLNDASELRNILINLEHSWIGDLEILITAPNGNQTILLPANNNGNDIYFGDTARNTPGPQTGLDYSFTERANATQTIVQAITSLALPAGSTLPSGSYLPQQSFDNLVGSPLNGDWCLQITDNLSQDNGYIFRWELDFDPSIIPNDLSFTPQEISSNWLPSPDIVAMNGNLITVEPTSLGINCYNFELQDSFGCTYIEEVCVEVLAPIDPVVPATEQFCGSDGIAQVTLSQFTATIINGNDWTADYYLSMNNATGQVNQLNDTIEINSDTEIFARVSNRIDCSAVIQFQLQFNPQPDPELEQGLGLCLDINGNLKNGGAILNSGLGSTGLNIVWELDGAIIPGESSPNLEVTQPGEYTIIAQDLLTGCIGTASTILRNQGVPDELDVSVTTTPYSFEHIITVTVVGPDDYLFQLDGSPFSNNATFLDVEPGPHVVTVIGSDGCGAQQVEVFVIGYPDFFTPNEDGFNDRWNVVNGDFFQDSVISIFDRHGKLLATISSQGGGWDGNYRGEPLPSSDYWFSVEYNENNVSKTATGHFSLKR
ncbi:MAG: T9SS type B sorting domain-containing protein [Nonlabens sp.]